MQLISKFNKGIRFLLCLIDIFSKYKWVIPLKGKNGITTANASQTILSESNRKPNKMWVDKGCEFYNRSIKSWLEKNAIKMYSTHNKGNIKPSTYIDFNRENNKERVLNLKLAIM